MELKSRGCRVEGEGAEVEDLQAKAANLVGKAPRRNGRDLIERIRSLLSEQSPVEWASLL